ncbi:hypothetical protein [Mesorhizobium waimense]|uniref:hypothetical protein n=1 Tax=Mesorhizobium waimense TaxID=1300307 RepID=UPI00142D64C3|nr:hypothetical protein [Mesorhizobium waimense]
MMLFKRSKNPMIPSHASRVLAGYMSGEKTGVKSEGNQTGADRTSFPGYAVQHRVLNKV